MASNRHLGRVIVLQSLYEYELRTQAKDPGVELHVDHIFPWSKGGETVFENLQTLCSKCNGGKSNLT